MMAESALWLSLGFMLTSANALQPPPFFPPAQPPVAGTPEFAIPTMVIYRFKGAKTLFPSAMSDDGIRTYIEWEADREMPAVFAINDQGQEILVDGYMRQGRYTIDRVYSQIIFRLDKDMARAIRTRVLKK